MLTKWTLAIGAAFLLAGPSAAQPLLPQQGEFELTFTFVNPIPFGTIQQPDGGALVHTWLAWLMNSEGGTFGNEMTGRCVTFYRIEVTATVELRGNCDYVDADGDHLYEVYDRAPGETGPVSGRWVGGTGKYQGVSGEIAIVGIGNRPTEDGYVLTAGYKTGTFSFQ